MITSTITSIAYDWKTSFDNYAIELGKNIDIWVKENIKEHGLENLNASTCPVLLSLYKTEFLYFFGEQINQWVEIQGLDPKTYESVLKPSNGLHFKDVESALYDRVSKKHQMDFVDYLIRCEIESIRSEYDDEEEEEY